jgi:hypothetical protein
MRTFREWRVDIERVVNVHGETALGVMLTDVARDQRAPVTTVRHVLGVAELFHQLIEGVCHLKGVESCAEVSFKARKN